MNQVHVSNPSKKSTKMAIINLSKDFSGRVAGITDKGAIFEFSSDHDATTFCSLINSKHADVSASLVSAERS